MKATLVGYSVLYWCSYKQVITLRGVSTELRKLDKMLDRHQYCTDKNALLFKKKTKTKKPSQSPQGTSVTADTAVGEGGGSGQRGPCEGRSSAPHQAAGPNSRASKEAGLAGRPSGPEDSVTHEG